MPWEDPLPGQAGAVEVGIGCRPSADDDHGEACVAQRLQRDLPGFQDRDARLGDRGSRCAHETGRDPRQVVAQEHAGGRHVAVPALLRVPEQRHVDEARVGEGVRGPGVPDDPQQTDSFGTLRGLAREDRIPADLDEIAPSRHHCGAESFLGDHRNQDHATVANMIISHGPQMLANSASALTPNAVTSTAAAPKTIARPMKPTLVGYAASWAGKLRIRRRAVAETVIMAAEMIANTTAFSPL